MKQRGVFVLGAASPLGCSASPRGSVVFRKGTIMKQRRVFVLGAALAVAIAFGFAPPTSAQQTEDPGQAQPNSMTPEYFRDVLLEFADLAAGMGVPSRALTESISGLTAEEMQTLYNTFPDAQTFAESVQILGSHFEVLAAVSEARAELETELGQREAMGVVGILPGINPFPPNYPSAGLLGFLEGLIDAVPGIDVDFTDEKQRCQDGFKLALTIAQTVGKALGTIAKVACDTIVVVCPAPGGTNLPTCILAGVANAVVDVAEFGLDACAAQQAAVDSAEIEAAFENSLLIFEGLKCVEVDAARKHHGCNGEDDDCDGAIDECDEDVFGPSVDIQVLRLGFRGEVLAFQTPVCYETVPDAENAVLAVTHAEDDCTVVVTSVSSGGDPCSLLVTSKAVDECSNENTDTVTVRVDSEAPVIACSATVLNDDDDARLRIEFSVTDNCGLESVSSVIETPCRDIPVVDGQTVELECEDDDCELDFENGILDIEATTATLIVTAEDECGNTATCTVDLCALVPED